MVVLFLIVSNSGAVFGSNYGYILEADDRSFLVEFFFSVKLAICKTIPLIHIFFHNNFTTIDRNTNIFMISEHHSIRVNSGELCYLLCVAMGTVI